MLLCVKIVEHKQEKGRFEMKLIVNIGIRVTDYSGIESGSGIDTVMLDPGEYEIEMIDNPVGGGNKVFKIKVKGKKLAAGEERLRNHSDVQVIDD